MTLCLFHPLNDVSLMAVSTAAFALKIGNFSDAAFMKKFVKCGEWFKQTSATPALGGLISYPKPAYLESVHKVGCFADRPCICSRFVPKRYANTFFKVVCP
jgi:hypothetical protein